MLLPNSGPTETEMINICCFKQLSFEVICNSSARSVEGRNSCIRLDP